MFRREYRVRDSEAFGTILTADEIVASPPCAPDLEIPDGLSLLNMANLPEEHRTNMRRMRRQITKDGCEPNSKKPLHLAAEKGNIDFIRELLKYNTEIEVLDSENQTPLMIAAMSGNAGILKCLIDAGAYVNKLNQYDESALHLSAKHGHKECLEILINAGASVNRSAKEGMTPLLLACLNNAGCDCIKVLSKAGADCNKTDKQRRSPLSYIVIYGGGEATTALIEAGASFSSIKEPRSHHPVLLALEAGNSSTLEALMKAGYDMPAYLYDSKEPTLHRMIKKPDCLRVLLSHGVPPDEPDRVGDTPLIHATCTLDVEAIDILLKGGANVNYNTPMSQTPLLKTLNAFPNNTRKLQIINMLIRNGADVNYRLGSPTSEPIHLSRQYCPLFAVAVGHGWLPVVHMFLIAGARTMGRRRWSCSRAAHDPSNEHVYDILKLISDWNSEARSLKHICRKVIRDSLRCNKQKSIQDLPIARIMKVYMDYEEFDLILSAHLGRIPYYPLSLLCT